MLNGQKIVDALLTEGKAPEPVKGYRVDSLTYDPHTYKDDTGTLYGQNTPTSVAYPYGDITIYSPGARTLEDAIVTYGHEIGHFNPSWTAFERLLDNYGQELLRVHQGFDYNGPTPP